MKARATGRLSGETAGRLLAGYLAACAGAAVTLGLYLGLRELVRDPSAATLGEVILGGVPGVLVILLAILSLSLPTFLLGRGVLHLMRRTGWHWFAAMGAVNAYGLVSVLMGADTIELYLTYPPDPAVAVAGAVGGLACWWAEQSLAGQTVQGAG